MSTETTPPSTTVVLIHGLWMTPLAWEHWVERYEARGCTVLTPGYPGIGQGEAGLQALRENPDAVAGVGAGLRTQAVQHRDRVAAELLSGTQQQRAVACLADGDLHLSEHARLQASFH